MSKETRHHESSVVISASPDEAFNYADDHENFSSHMNRSSWMMGGGKMETTFDEGHGQKVGSHIQMTGEVFGIGLSLDEVVTIHEPPSQKAWQTVGTPKLLVIGDYKMGFEITPDNQDSNLKVYIDYELPKSQPSRWLGHMFSGMYAKWCVKQMVSGVKEHFEKK
jgi:hypothetical protein